MAKTLTYSIKIQGTAQQVKDLTNVEIQLKKLTAERNNLIKTAVNYENRTKTLTEEEKQQYEQIKQKLSALGVQIRNNQATRTNLNKEIKNTSTLNQSAVGSYDRLTAANSKLTKTIKKLNPNLPAQRKQFDLIAAKIKSNNDKLKAYDEQMGRFNRNVGNYAGDIKSVFSQFGVNFGQLDAILNATKSGFSALTKSVTGTTAAQQANTTATTTQGKAQKATAVTTNLFSKALKLLKVALISTGVGALVVALGSLVAYFTRSEEGASKLQRILAPFKILIGNIGDLFSKLGKGIVNAFSNPKESITKLWELIKTNIVNRITGVADQFKALGKIVKSALKLDFDGVKEGALELAEATTQTLTGVDELGKKVQQGLKNAANGVKGFVDEAVKETKILKQLEDDQLALQKRQRDAEVGNAKIAEQVAALRIKAKKEDIYSDEERLKFLDEAIRLEGKKLSNDLAIKEEQLRIAKTRASLSDSDKETLDEVASLEAEVYNARASFQKAQLRLESERQTTIKKITAQNVSETKKAIANIAKEYQSLDVNLSESVENTVTDIVDTFQVYKDQVKNSNLTAKEQAELVSDIVTKQNETIALTLQKREQTQTQAIENETKTQIAELSKRYADGLITEDQYTRQKEQITSDSEKRITDIQIQANNERLLYESLTEEQRAQIATENANLIIEQNERVAEQRQQQREQEATEEQTAQEEQKKRQEEYYNEQLAIINNASLAEQLALEQLRAKGEISEQEYQNRLKDIKFNTQRESLDAYISFLQTQLENDNLTTQQRIDLANQLKDAQIQAAQAVTDYTVATNEEQKQSTLNTLSAVQGYVNNIGGSINGILSGISQRVENEYDKQIAAAKGNEKKQEQLEKEKAIKVAEIQRKQALVSRAQALFNIAVNTPSAVMKVTEQLGIGAAAAIPIVIGLSGLQAAAVLSEPLPEIPQFATGGYVVGGSGTWRSDNQPALLSPKEAVINARSMTSNDVLNLTGTPAQIASEINSYKGYGVKFATGRAPAVNLGSAPAVSSMQNISIDMDNFATQIIQGINDKRVINIASETESVINRNNVINRAGDV